LKPGQNLALKRSDKGRLNLEMREEKR